MIFFYGNEYYRPTKVTRKFTTSALDGIASFFFILLLLFSNGAKSRQCSPIRGRQRSSHRREDETRQACASCARGEKASGKIKKKRNEKMEYKRNKRIWYLTVRDFHIKRNTAGEEVISRSTSRMSGCGQEEKLLCKWQVFLSLFRCCKLKRKELTC